MEAAGIPLRREGHKDHPGKRHLRPGRFTFAFVREPLSWWASFWAFRREHQMYGHRADEWLPLPFPAYLEKVLEVSSGHYSDLCFGIMGPEPLDYVGRYENLVEDLIHALRLADQPFRPEAIRSLPPVNVSNEIAAECPEPLVKRLRVAEKRVYERFYP